MVARAREFYQIANKAIRVFQHACVATPFV